MDPGVSKSDLEFDFDDSGSNSGSDSDSDISIATDASSFNDQFEESMALNDINGEEYEGRLRGNTEDSDDFGPPIVVPLKTGSDHSGGEEPIEPGSRSSRGSRRSTRSGSFNRRPPVRTKSGEGMTGSSHSVASGRRRPPPRTKSGKAVNENEEEEDGNIRRRPPRRMKSGSSQGIRRRAPLRTKSGGTLRSKNDSGDDSHDDDTVDDLPDDGSFDESSPTSRLRGEGREDNAYRQKALSANMARRQRSSDMLGAMREATRNVPSRSRSEMGGITNGRRRATGRSRSNDLEELASPGRMPLRRKAPARTKSGSGSHQIASPPLEA